MKRFEHRISDHPSFLEAVLYEVEVTKPCVICGKSCHKGSLAIWTNRAFHYGTPTVSHLQCAETVITDILDVVKLARKDATKFKERHEFVEAL
jgi:hypothetical protein